MDKIGTKSAASILIIALTIWASCALAADLYVDKGAVSGINDGTMAYPFMKIQAAIDSAQSGDSIHVASGVYPENILIEEITLRLLGGYESGSGDFDLRDPSKNTTHIQGDGTDSVVTMIYSGESVVDGFRITGGSGGGEDPDAEWFSGGGFYCNGGAPTLSNNIIENNDLSQRGGDKGLESEGGGIYATWADISIIGNTIRYNLAGFGAGIKIIHDGRVVIQNNVIQENIGGNDHGGGMHIYANPAIISNNHVFGNVTGRELGYGYGGGILVYGTGCYAQFSNNVIHDNYAPIFGGGEFIDDGAEAVIRHELIYNNRVDGLDGIGGGAGIFVDGGADESGRQVGSVVQVENCTIVGNSCSDTTLTGCGLQINEASQVTVTNSIFWENGGDDFDVEVAPFPASLTVTYSDSEEPIEGAGNFSLDPMFADPDTHDYHLKSTAGRWRVSENDGSGGWVTDSVHSPCIDTGTPQADHDSEHAPNGGRINIGAYGNSLEASLSSNGGPDNPDIPDGPGNQEDPDDPIEPGGPTSDPFIWESRGIGAGGALFSPTISPHDPNTIYMATDMSSVFKTENFGQTWETIHFNQLWGGINSHVRFTSDPTILYTVSLADDFRTPMKTIDGGQTWSQITGDPTYREAYGLHADPESTNGVLIASYDTLYYSSDGGEHFASVHTHPDGLHIAGVFWNGNEIFVGTDKGLLVSTDRGATFSFAQLAGISGDEAMVSFSGAKVNGIIRFFTVTLGSPDVWPGLTGAECIEYRGVYRLDWGENSWTSITSGLPESAHPFFVATALDDIDTAYLAGGDLESSFPMVYKTVDGGNTWQDIFLAENNQNISTGWCGNKGDLEWWYPEFALGLAVSPNDSNRVIVTDLGFVHVTDDGGENWGQAYVDPLTENPPGSITPKGGVYKGVGLEQTSVWWLHWADKDTLLAAFTDIRGIRSTDGGTRWTSGISSGLPHNTTYHFVEHPDTKVIYAATSSVHDMYEVPYLADEKIDGGEGHVIMSHDKGERWHLLKDFGHPVIWLAIDPDDPDTLYASVIHSQEGGIYVTHNLSAGCSATWERLTPPPRTEGHPFNIHLLNDGTMVVTYSGRRDSDGVFTESSGVFVSQDRGITWEDRSDPNMVRWTKDIVIDPHDPDQNSWYASVFSHWGTSPIDVGGLYHTTDRGQTWNRLTTDLFRVDSCTLHPENPDILYLSTEAQGLWKTTNLTDPTPTFTLVEGYLFKEPVRIFFNPYDSSEIWTVSYGAGMHVNRSGTVLLVPTEVSVVLPTTQAEIDAAPVHMYTKSDSITFSCNVPLYGENVDIFFAYVNPQGVFHFPNSSGELGLEFVPYRSAGKGGIQAEFTVSSDFVFSKGIWQVYWLVQPAGADLAVYELGGYTVNVE